MSINATNLEQSIQIIANSVTTANTTADFINIAKAIQFCNSGQLQDYSTYSAFPAATSLPRQFVLALDTNTIYYSNGTNWVKLGAFTDSVLTQGSLNAITTSTFNNIVKTLKQAETLAEIKNGWSMFSWGNNTNSQLGLGNTTSYSSPVQVGTSYNWNFVSIGDFSGNALDNVGNLWSWGSNTYGQLGLGDTTNTSTPVQVTSGIQWFDVSCGSGNVLAVKSDGTLWSWGYNNYGQLGVGNITSYSSPVQVGALTNWKQVSTVDSTSIAVKSDGTLWAWGYNNAGQLGLGNVTNYSSPVQVGALTNWKQVIASGSSVLAIKTNGTLWSWGNNSNGQLGLGDTTSYSSPIQVGALTNWKQVSRPKGGGTFSTAIKSDGTLWTWGNNQYGQLGLGNTTSYSSPVQVGALTNWKQVNCGTNSTAILKTDGSLWTVGYNVNGQLGLGNTTSYSSPVQVGTLTNWKQVSFNGSSIIAVTYPLSSGTYVSNLQLL